MGSEWIEYDSAGYPHKRAQPQGEAMFLCNDCSERFADESSANAHSVETEHSFANVQPQGEARCERTGNLCGSDTWMEGRSCPCKQCQAWLAAQTESEKKPVTLYKGTDLAMSGNCGFCQKIHVGVFACPDRLKNERLAQPAGGSREWRLRMDLLGVSQHDFWDDMRAQGYADQRVRQEREARERAEKALRRYARHHEPNAALNEALSDVKGEVTGGVSFTLDDIWQAAIQAERERCAKIAESRDHVGCVLLSECHSAIADAIRRGGEH